MRRTGHIRERSPGRWEIRFSRDGKTRTATVRGSRKDAERELRRRLVAADAGGTIGPTKMTTGAWFEKWLGIVKPEISPMTFIHYRRAVASYLRPRLGAVPLAKLSRAHVQQFFSDLSEGGRADGKPGTLAPSTRKHCTLC